MASRIPTLILTAALVPAATAQCELQELAGVGGSSLAIEGDLALVGAQQALGPPTASGAVFVYRKPSLLDPWTLIAKITAFDGAPQDRFGHAVALRDGRAIVGAPDDDDAGSGAGSAYVFTLFGGVAWTLDDKLLPAGVAQGDLFGDSVAIDGLLAAVGAPRDDDAGSEAGAVYVFEKQGGSWVETAKLTGSDGAFARFGLSVALDGERLLVGAPRANTSASAAGAAYVFERQAGAWVQVARLVPEDLDQFDEFGRSVALRGNLALIGQPHQNVGGADAGAAYLYEGHGGVWSQVAKLEADDGEPFDHFGQAVALDAQRAVIGAYRDDAPGLNNHGSAYAFAKEGGAWKQQKKLVSCTVKSGDEIGTSVALDGMWTFVGAPGDDTGGLVSGSALVWQAPLAGAGGVGDAFCPGVSALAFPVQAEVLNADGTSQVLKLGTVTAATEPGGRVVATFDLTDAGPSLDLCNDFRWIHVETAYWEDGVPQSVDPVVGLLPAIDPTPASDAMPFYHPDAVWGSGSAGPDVVHAEGVHSRFVQEPSPAGTNAVLHFRTFLVARDIAQHSAPLEAPVPLAGFSWRYESAGDTATLCRPLRPAQADVILSALANGLAPGHPGHPGFPGWSLTQDVALQSTIAALCADTDAIPYLGGKQVAFWLEFGAGHEGAPYFLLGTTSGTVPGTPILGATLPLNQDTYFDQTLFDPDGSPLVGSQGTVDAIGFDNATFELPPAGAPALAGLVLHHAWAVIDGGTAAVSNPVELRMTP